ncbi:MAG: peptidase [Gemmatimonadetes bacterium]|nr:peptidase [Gemmatimonadota bacterium]
MQPFQNFLLIAPVLLFSVIAHEVAHGYAALKQGDPTAWQLGRLTWNPVKHIDPFMTILLPALLILTHAGMILGGAKPVPVNPRNYRNFKRGDIIVSLAGVATNFVVAIACTALIAIVRPIGSIPALTESVAILQMMFSYGVFINLSLIAFNLLPVPPLDGSHVMKYLLPPAWALQYQRVGFFGIFLLLLLMQTRFFSWWMTPPMFLTDVLLRLVAPLTLPSQLAQ